MVADMGREIFHLFLRFFSFYFRNYFYSTVNCEKFVFTLLEFFTCFFIVSPNIHIKTEIYFSARFFHF